MIVVSNGSGHGRVSCRQPRNRPHAGRGPIAGLEILEDSIERLVQRQRMGNARHLQLTRTMPSNSGAIDVDAALAASEGKDKKVKSRGKGKDAQTRNETQTRQSLRCKEG